MPHHHHILIIGGGIVGLTLAQALRKQHPTVRCTVYERDASPSSRGAGWGLTIHWALATFLELVPGDISARLEEETYVDAEASRAGDGNFLLYDLRSGQERYRVPPNRRIRVRREALRRLLMEGVSIEVSFVSASLSHHFVWGFRFLPAYPTGGSLTLFYYCVTPVPVPTSLTARRGRRKGRAGIWGDFHCIHTCFCNGMNRASGK